MKMFALFAALIVLLMSVAAAAMIATDFAGIVVTTVLLTVPYALWIGARRALYHLTVWQLARTVIRAEAYNRGRVWHHAVAMTFTRRIATLSVRARMLA